MTYPNLAKIATADLVSTVGGGKYSASYINWSRTMQLLRDNAPGWLPEVLPSAEDGLLHRAPQGAYLLIRLVHADGTTTPPVPQAVMDNRNDAIAFEDITARDITDTHVRGICKALALHFGLAYELWAKLALESGYADAEQDAKPKPKPNPDLHPAGDVWATLTVTQADKVNVAAANMREYLDMDDLAGAIEYKARAGLDADETVAFWTFFNSYERAALKKAHDGDLKAATDHLINNRKKASK